MRIDARRIYVDFLNADGDGRLILSSNGTLKDLERYGIELREGLALPLYSDDADEYGEADDLVVQGIAHYDEVAKRWVAVIDWDEIKHDSEL